MKKFAANYLITDSGDLLKNSILIAEDDGSVLEYVDTQGQLQEISKLIFYNGILLGGFNFIRIHQSPDLADADQRFSSVVLSEVDGDDEISIHRWLALCKKVAEYFPDMIVTEIMRGITTMLCDEGGFRKEPSPGIFLLTGSDLLVLKLTDNSRLKRIL